MEPTDIVLGQVELRIETIATVGSITFWNHGSVSALAINKQSRAEHVLDDRKLQPSDSVPSLLDRYFREITELESSR